MAKGKITADVPAKAVGLHFGEVCAINVAGELAPLFGQMSITPLASPACGERRWVISFLDHQVDPIAGLISGASQVPSATERVTDRQDDLATEPRRAARETPDLVVQFLRDWQAGEIADITKGGRDVPAAAIGVRKRDPSWDNKMRTFLFSTAMQSMFPDRTDRDRLVRHLVEEGIIVPTGSRTDTHTTSVQIAGTSRKAYRIGMKKLRRALDAT